MAVSNETKRILDEATTVVGAARAEADARRRECLDLVADGIPGAVDGVAKRIAQSQPDVTRGLGATGVKALREELAVEATVLAENVRSGSGKIEWPEQDSEWSKVEPRNVHSALFKFMYGTPVNRIGKVFGRHGYEVHDGVVLPQELYDESSFGPVVEALNNLGAAEIALRKAKADDDRDVVDSLWDKA